MSNTKTNTSWDAAHTVIGFIAMQGIRSITTARLAEICKSYSVDCIDGVKSKVATHYKIVFADNVKAEYILAL